MIFSLIQDFADALAAMPREHPRYRILKLLDEAIRRDVHFIDRHPTTFFQCMWNTCWWYDCPEAAGHYETEGTLTLANLSSNVDDDRLYLLLVAWRRCKDATTPGFLWLRNLRPSPFRLGNGNVLTLSYEGCARAVAFSRDGSRVLATGDDKTLRLWDTATGRQLFSFTGHEDAVTSATLSPDGKRIASLEKDKNLRVWDAETGALFVSINNPAFAEKACVGFSPDNGVLAAVIQGQEIAVIDVDRGREFIRFKSDGEAMQSVAFSPDSQYLLTKDVEGDVRQWETRTGRVVSRLKGVGRFKEGVGCSIDGRLLGIGARGGVIQIWDMQSSKLVRVWPAHDWDVASVAFSWDNQRIVSGGFDRTVRIWDAQGTENQPQLRAHRGSIRAITFSRNGRRAASGGADGTMRLWSTTDGQELLCVPGHEGGVTAVAFSPEGEYIASGGEDSILRIWSAARGDCRLEIGGDWKYGIESATFSPDGKHLAFGAGSGSVRVWNIATNALVACYHTYEGPSALAYSPDGQKIVAGLDRCVLIFEVLTGKQVACLSGHASNVNQLAFSSDGRQLVTGCGGGQVRIWDVETGNCLLQCKGGSEVHAIAAAGWQAAPGNLETSLHVFGTSNEAAWFGTVPRLMTCHPSTRTWIATSFNEHHLYIFRLEGPDESRTTKWYYTLDRRRAIGPITPADLRRLVESGNLSKDALISQDKKKWYRATKLRNVKWPEPNDTGGKQLTP